MTASRERAVPSLRPRLARASAIVLMAAVGYRCAVRDGATHRASPAAAVTVLAMEWKFVPSSLVVRTHFTVSLRSPSGRHHHWIIRRNGVELEDSLIHTGSTFTGHNSFAMAPGTYEFVCNLPQHEAAGMRGTLFVSDTP